MGDEHDGAAGLGQPREDLEHGVPVRLVQRSGRFVGDDEFKEEWFGVDDEGNSLHEIGLRGGWDAATRDEELDRLREAEGDLLAAARGASIEYSEGEFSVQAELTPPSSS